VSDSVFKVTTGPILAAFHFVKKSSLFFRLLPKVFLADWTNYFIRKEAFFNANTNNEACINADITLFVLFPSFFNTQLATGS